MSLDLSLVPYGMLHTVLPEILPHIATSEKWSKGRSSVDDIIGFIFSGKMQLWVVLDESKIYGHIVSEVKHYPQCKMFTVHFCAMQPHVMHEIEDKMQDVAERFAKDNGCAGIEFIGRPGWSKSMKRYGYDIQSIIYQKFFREPT